MKRTSVLVGAGANVEIGGPTTNELTEIVKREKQNIYTLDGSYTIDFINQIAAEIENYTKTGKCNFEDILHVIEFLRSFRKGLMFEDTAGSIVPFIKIKDPKWVRYNEIVSARDDFMKVICDKVYEKTQNVNFIDHKWYKEFWKRVNDKGIFDIFTLNYDCLLEDIIGPAKYENGFKQVDENIAVFNASKIIDTNLTRVVNLHGSIYFGRYDNHKKYNDMAKYSTYEKACKNQTQIVEENQAKETLVAGPIIAGLRKTEKIINLPFVIYNYIFQRSLYENNSLLIVGYSFNDNYINNIIRQFIDLHKEKYKLIIVTLLSNDDNEALRCFIEEIGNDKNLFKDYVNKDFIETQNGYLRVYHKGFKHAVTNNENDLLKSL